MKEIPVESGTKKIAPHGGKVLLEWTAPEYVKHVKGKQWFIIAGLVIVALVIYAIQTGSWTMAVAFIVLAGVYYLLHHQEPSEVSIQLTDFDIRIGTKSIPYSYIKAFWILYQPPRIKTLKLLTSDKILGEVGISLQDQPPGSVRDLLVKHIPEYEGKTESFVDMLIRSFKL